MYKLMIAEDEPLIRTGLTRYFDWPALGFEHIVEAENGLEGMQLALREKPDLIITDIRMPLMDGLEMIAALRPKLPDTLFIIWSGYNDFTYAQKAIRLGSVHAYLLKPLQYEDSLATLKDCIQLLDKQRMRSHAVTVLEQERLHHTAAMRSRFIKNVLEDGYVSEQMEQALMQELAGGTRGSSPSDSGIIQPLILSYVPQYGYPFHASRKWWRQQAETILGMLLNGRDADNTGHPSLFAVYQHHSLLYALIICNPSAEPPFSGSSARSRANGMLQLEGERHQVKLYLSVGSPASEPVMLPEVLSQTEKAMFQRFHSGRQHILAAPAPVQAPAKSAPIPFREKDRAELLSCLEHGKNEQLQAFMAQAAEDIQPKIPLFTRDQWRSYFQEIISVAIRFAGKHGIQMEERYHEKLLDLSFIEEFDSIPHMFQWLASWMIQLQSETRHSGAGSEPQDMEIFRRIEAFVLQFIDQDVTLQAVADQFFYNPSYLSRLFKTKLNKNFSTFVAEIRIEHAKRCLLQSKTSMTDVCHMCGYTSYKHFVKVFRKFTNMTPTEYRKQMGMID